MDCGASNPKSIRRGDATMGDTPGSDMPLVAVLFDLSERQLIAAPKRLCRPAVYALSAGLAQQTSGQIVRTVNAANVSSFLEHGALLGPRRQGLTRSRTRSVQQPENMAARPLGAVSAVCPRLHQLSGPVGRSINLHKTDIKSLSSRDAARRSEVVRVVSSTISIKRPTRSTRASPIAR
jgi:hypothetical protein